MVAKHYKNVVSQVMAFMLFFSCHPGPTGQKWKSHDIDATVFYFPHSTEKQLWEKGGITMCAISWVDVHSQPVKAKSQSEAKHEATLF